MALPRFTTAVRTRRRVRLGALAVATVAAALALTGCSGTGGGNSSGSSKSITELDYYTDTAGTKAWQKILDACSSQTGISIKRQSVPAAQLLPKVLQQASSHTLPNLFFIDNPNLQQIASTGALVPLTDYGIDTDGYFPSILKAGTYQGKVYGIAPGVNGLALFYNKDILAKAHLTPPTTWAELKSDAAKLTSGKQYGLAFSAIATEEGVWQFLPAFWSNGADLKQVDSAKAAQALQFWSDLVHSGAASKSVVNWNQNDVNDQFMAGNAAMEVNGSWNLPMLDGKPSLHYGVVPLPTPQSGGKPVVALGGEVGAISVSSKDAQTASGKVLSCILDAKNVLSWDKMHDYVPSKQSTAATFAKQVPAMQTFVQEVATARSRTAELGQKYTAVSAALGTAIQQAITGTKSAAAALSAAQKQAQSGS